MVTKRKPVKRKKDAGAREAGHPVSMPEMAAKQDDSSQESPSVVAPVRKSVVTKRIPKRRVKSNESVSAVEDTAAVSAEENVVSPDEKLVAKHIEESNAAAIEVGAAKEATVESVVAKKKTASEATELGDSAPAAEINGSASASEASADADLSSSSASDAEASDEAEPTKPEAESASHKSAPHKVGKKRKSIKDAAGESKTPRQLNPKLRIALAVSAGVLAVLLVIVGAFSWNRWFRYDDALDMVGEWQIHGSEAVILMDGQYMTLSSNAVFTYEIDDTKKTIHFWLGDMEGNGRYRFAADRNQLIIEDGEFDSWLANAWNDAGWQLNQLMHALFNAPLRDSSGAGMSVLDRAGVPIEEDVVEEEVETTEEEAAAAEDVGEDAASEEAGEEAAAEGAEAADAESQEAATKEEFQGSTSSGPAGGNAVTLEEFQGIA